MLLAAPTVAGSVVQVDADATGGSDGTSWIDAYVDLQDALDGVALHGGFAGGETALAQRVPVAHPTRLSGDLGAPGASSDNAYHVATAVGLHQLPDQPMQPTARQNRPSASPPIDHPADGVDTAPMTQRARRTTAAFLSAFFLAVLPAGTRLAAQTDFQRPIHDTGGGSASASAFAYGDLDGDGRPDAAVVHAGSNKLGVLLARPGGGFEAPVGYTTGAAPRA